MALFPIGQLNKMRPNWAQLDAAELLMIAEGDSIATIRRDATQYLILIEGRTAITAGSITQDAEAGELLIVRAGDSCSIGPAAENTVVLRLGELSHPPFRDAPFRHDEPGPVSLAPLSPMVMPDRRAFELKMELDATFSPHALSEFRGQDVLLRANPGALSPAQAREYRSVSRAHHQATLALSLDLEDNEIEPFFIDTAMSGNLELLRPQALSITADLTTETGRRRLGLAWRSWHPFLRSDGYRLVAEMPLRLWSDDELRQFFLKLKKYSPSQVGIMLQWSPEYFRDFRARKMVEALIPWLHAIVFDPATLDMPELAHYMQGAGYQGWLVSRR